jgi:alpha-ketoglutarate-dependent taurine dioxygenase
MQLKNIFENWGTEFTDINDIFEQDPKTLRRTLYERKMLVFHTPDWDKLTYWKFCNLFGDPWHAIEYAKSQERWERVSPANESPKFITSISNKISARLVDYEMPWHSDIPNRVGNISFPHRSIYMKTVPNPAAGFTYWLNMDYAYPLINSELRARWEALTVIQQSWHRPGSDITEYPSMKVHPVTGTKSPRCNFHGQKDSWIIDTKLNGVSQGTGIVQEVIDAMIAVPDSVYTHRWAPNDIVLYDNWPFVHRRDELHIKPGEERLMWRVNMEHDFTLEL